MAIDGKTLCRSYDKASGKSAIHLVSAWATANHISLGQVVVDAKSNEITAIPKLLELIEISGALVTIDAMGRQTEIAAKIVEAEADYCLAAKGSIHRFPMMLSHAVLALRSRLSEWIGGGSGSRGGLRRIRRIVRLRSVGPLGR